jgi:hypothetical protein
MLALDRKEIGMLVLRLILGLALRGLPTFLHALYERAWPEPIARR